MTECLERAGSNLAPAALILFDIDDFKAVNDRYGHPVGDGVLRGIARIVTEHFGQGAIFGRLGGEEFGVFLPEARDHSACQTAEDLRNVIARQQHSESGPPIGVTASFGVATIARPCDVDELMSRADEALYVAKRRGRNRVECNCIAEHAIDADAG